MIQYPENYFKEEIRCGFRITELMKRCWAAQIEVLAQIEKICDKYKLEYFAFAGTLLGAVRHKGFIPWDDDLDIVMKRKDYMVLMNVISKEMPEGYEILSIYSKPDWENTFARVVNTRNIPLSGEHLAEYHGFPLSAGIDIFPLDYIPMNKELAVTQKSLLDLSWRMIANVIRDRVGLFNEEEHEQVIRELQEGITILSEFCSIPSAKKYSLLQIVQLIFDQLCMLGNEDNSDTCTVISSFHREGYEWVYPNRYFDNFEYMSFEYGKIKVPCNYDEVLRIAFGNYMRYVRMEAGHGYPYYKEQISVLKEKRLWHYNEDPKDIGQEEEREIKYTAYAVEEEWKLMISIGKSEGKRVVLLQPMLTSMLAYEDCYVDAIGILIESFINNPRVLLWFRPHLNEHVPYMDLNPKLFERYNLLCDKYSKCKEIILDKTDNLLGAIEYCDLYVGDDCEIAELFKANDKKSFVIDYKSNRLEKFAKNF